VRINEKIKRSIPNLKQTLPEYLDGFVSFDGIKVKNGF